MLAIFTLSLLIFTQTTLASSSDDGWLDLRDLSHLLDAEKRYADKYAASMRGKRTTTIKPGYEKKCDQDPIDLGLIIDSSVSIDSRDYTKGQKFLADFLDEYNIGPDKNQVRVAAVSFGKTVYTDDGFNFTTFVDKEEVKKHVREMPFRAGPRTDTGDALKHMREVQMTMRRPWAVQIALVLTDGNSQLAAYTESQATETKEANITVFAVGVGRYVRDQELLNIAGGVKEHVFRASSYDDLDDDIKQSLTRKTCKLVPKPTTTTVPSTPAAQPCGLEFPADINFIFSAATMGLDQTSTVTSFISNVINFEELNEGFQYGVVSGDCPDDEGFRLNQYNSPWAIREHLERYDRNNLPDIIHRATETRFTSESGARVNATKTAVIFLGTNKVNEKELGAAIERMVASDVRVFVSVSDYKILSGVASYLHNEVILLEGGTFNQAAQLVNHLCPDAKKFEEGENLPDYVYDYEGFARS